MIVSRVFCSGINRQLLHVTISLMGKRGPKPKRDKIKWSPELAYAVGLITTDGSLSKDGRHIDLTSKDREQLENFLYCLNIKHIKIGKKKDGRDGYYGRVQFGDIVLYNFLVNIGLTVAKTKTMGHLKIPRKYFPDFLRGHFDGDGCFYSFWDKRWRNSFVFYTVFISSSKKHILWLRDFMEEMFGVRGHICKDSKRVSYQLKYAKKESLVVLSRMYYSSDVVCLSRKRLKIKKALGIVDESIYAQVAELVDALA